MIQQRRCHGHEGGAHAFEVILEGVDGEPDRGATDVASDAGAIAPILRAKSAIPATEDGRLPYRPSPDRSVEIALGHGDILGLKYFTKLELRLQ